MSLQKMSRGSKNANPDKLKARNKLQLLFLIVIKCTSLLQFLVQSMGSEILFKGNKILEIVRI